MEKDFNIFDGKNFSDLSKEIYDNSKLKKTQLDLLIQEVHGYIQGIEDIALVGPIIKELFDASIKNDDNLLKLATVIQRIMNKQADAVDDTALLSEDEKEELMASLEDAAASLQNKSDEIESSITKVRKQVNE
tara:strand:+ start:597 stop:995 length:399 start_codon:yes stop_codon:yes gene_type:complete